jgi:hypothetical protein
VVGKRRAAALSLSILELVMEMALASSQRSASTAVG